ncbi:MAG: efflux RND transporter periplasmic adaptor subunit, partial [Pseudomonadota bacterium]
MSQRMDHQQRMRRASKLLLKMLPLGFLVFVAACQEQKAATPAPAPKVEVATAQSETIPLYLELTGRTETPNTVMIRSRVDGHVESRSFEEGADVGKGDTLFVIDQRPYEAALTQLTGERDSNQASLAFAQKEVERFTVLEQDGTVAPEELDEKKTTADQAQGDLKSSEGAVQSAQVNLDYTTVTAPIDGRIGRVYQDVGNVVSGNETVLVELVTMDPLYVYISPSESQYLDLNKYLSANPNLNVRISLIDGTTHPHVGTLDFSNPGVDPDTGTIAVRAVFANPDKTLRPGQYATVRVQLTEQEGLVTVPAEAVGQDQAGFYVFVVGEQNKTDQRRVTVGRIYDGKRIVETGLKADEVVIVKGQQRVRSGM